jgi:nucleotide-binding universal stress UspA family protein
VDFFVVAFFWAAIVGVCMIIIAYLATRWGRDAFGWVLLAAVLGPIALVALYGTRQSDTARPRSPETSGERQADVERTVLIAVDGSAPATRAAQHLVEMGSPVTEALLLTVLPREAKPAAGASDAEHERAVESALQGAREVLQRAGVPVRTAVAYGVPGEEIVRCAEGQDVELILMGRKGRGLTKALLGSVSDYVSKRANRPVALVD